MTIRQILSQLNEMNLITIMAYIHHCAVLPKDERKRFVKDYGEKTDKNLTKLMGKLMEK